MAAALRSMPFPATAAAAALGIAFVMRIFRQSDPDSLDGPVPSEAPRLPQQTFGHPGPQNVYNPTINTPLISTSTITEMATLIWSSTLTSTVTETPTLGEAVSHAFTRGSITQPGNLIPATGLGLLLLLLLWALATVFISAFRRAGRSDTSTALTRTWWFRRLYMICEQSSKCHECPRYEGERHHVCGDEESAFMTALENLQTTTNLLQNKVNRMETNQSITTNKLEEIIQQLQAPRLLPATHTSFDSSGQTEPPSKPSKLAKEAEASSTKESTPVKINLPALDSKHWLIRVLKISWTSFNLGQRKVLPGDFYTAEAAGLAGLSKELDQDYYDTSIRDIVKEACEQPDLLFDPGSRIRRMQKRVTDIEQTYSAYIQAYGYPTPTITFNANDAYSDLSDSGIDDLVEDERHTRPAVPASATRTRTQPVEDKYSYGRNTTSKTRYEKISTDAKTIPMDNKSRYRRSTAPKTRYELGSTESKAEPVANKYSYGNRIPSKTRYEKDSTETKAESSSRISKTARDLGSPVISRSKQQGRRPSGTNHQATVENGESRQNDAVDSRLFNPPDLDDFERAFSSASTLTTKVLKQLAERDQQEQRRKVEEQQKPKDVSPINLFYQAPTLPKADASSKATPATRAPSTPVKGISLEAVPPKLPAKKAAAKEAGPKQLIPMTTAPKVILSKDTLRKEILTTRNLPTGALPKEIPPKELPAQELPPKEIPPKKSPIEEVPPKKRSGKHVRIVTPPRSLNLRSDDDYIVSTSRIRGDAHSNGQTAGEIFLTVFPEGARTLPTSSQGLRCGIHAMAKSISMLCPDIDEAAVRSQLLGVALKDPLLKAVDESRSGFDQIHLDQILQEWNKKNNMHLRLCIVLESDQINPDGSFVATLHIPGTDNQREDLEPTSPMRTVFIHNDNVEMIAPGRGLMNHWRALTSVSGPAPTLPPIKQPVRVSANDSVGQPNAPDGAASQPASKSDASDIHIHKPIGAECLPGDESRMQGVQETGQGLVLPESGGPLSVPLHLISANATHGKASVISAGNFGISHREFESSAHTHVSTAPLAESDPFGDAMELEKTEMPRIERPHQRHDSYQGMTGIEFTENRALQQQISVHKHRVGALPTTTEVEMGNTEPVEGSGYNPPYDHDSLFSSPPETPPSMRPQDIASRPAAPEEFSPMQVQDPSPMAKESVGPRIDISASPMKIDGGQQEDAGLAGLDVPIPNPVDNAQLLSRFGALTIEEAKDNTARPPPPQSATFDMPDAPSYEQRDDAYSVVPVKSDAESRENAKLVGAIVEVPEYNPYAPMVQQPLQQLAHTSSSQPEPEPLSASHYNPYAPIVQQPPQQSIYPPPDQPPAQQQALPQSAAHYGLSAEQMKPESYQQLLSYTYANQPPVQPEAESQLASHYGPYAPIEQQPPQQSSYPSPDQPPAQPHEDPQSTSLPPLKPLSSDSDLSSIEHEFLLTDPIESIRIQQRFDGWITEAHEQWKELDHDAFRDRGLVRYADYRIEDVSDDMKDRKFQTVKELEDAIQIAEDAMLKANDAAMDARSAADKANEGKGQPGQDQLDEFVRRAYDREERREDRAATKVSELTARARKTYDLEQKWDNWAELWDPRLEGLFTSTLGTERESQVRNLIKSIESEESDVLTSDFLREKDLTKACAKFERNLSTLEKMAKAPAKAPAPRRMNPSQKAAPQQAQAQHEQPPLRQQQELSDGEREHVAARSEKLRAQAAAKQAAAKATETVPGADEQEQKKKEEEEEEATASLMARYGTNDLRTIQDELLQKADALAQERQNEAKARQVFPYASPRDKKGPNLFKAYMHWCRPLHEELIKFINALPELMRQMQQLQDLSLPLEAAVALAEESLDDLRRFHERTQAHDWRSSEQMKVAMTETIWKLRGQLQKLLPQR